MIFQAVSYARNNSPSPYLRVCIEILQNYRIFFVISAQDYVRLLLKIVYKYVTDRDEYFPSLSSLQRIKEGVLLSLLGYERKIKKKFWRYLHFYSRYSS